MAESSNCPHRKEYCPYLDIVTNDIAEFALFHDALDNSGNQSSRHAAIIRGSSQEISDFLGHPDAESLCVDIELCSVALGAIALSVGQKVDLIDYEEQANKKNIFNSIRSLFRRGKV